MSKKTMLCAVCTAAFMSVWIQAAPAAELTGAGLIPPPIGLPAPAGFMKILQMLTFYLHILMVNVVLGSVLLAVLDRRTAATGGRGEISFMPKALALAVNFAIAPFLFVQVVYGSFIYPTVVLMAVWWVSIFLLVMLAYYGLYVGDGEVRPDRRGPALLLVAVLLLFTAFLLTNMSSLMLRPDRWLAWFADPHGTVLNLGDPSLFPRYLHMVNASLALGGLVMAWRARWSLKKPGMDRSAAEERARRGLTWFFYASLAQPVLGLLFLFTLRPEVRALFLGGSALHTGALLLVLSGLALALTLARKGELKLTTLAVLGVVLIMVGVRDLVRDATLEPYIRAVTPATSDIVMPHGQVGAVALFLICLLVALAALFWMGKVLLKYAVRGGGAPRGND